jgi:hypothetical protein
MPPQAIFAATCHVTPLATAPDRRNTVLGPGQSGFVNSGPDLPGQTVSTDARRPQPGCGSVASTNTAGRHRDRRRPAYPRDTEKLEPCVHLKRSVQLFPYVDLGPRQDPLEGPADGPSCGARMQLCR